MIRYTKQFSKRGAAKQKYAYLMLEVEKPQQLIKFQNSIDKEDLHQRGLEKYSHITVAPQIQNGIKLRELVQLTEPADSYDMEVIGVSKFNRPDWDVLKFDIKSKNLQDTNRKISTKYPTLGEFKSFHPHLTIGYLKKGTADKYIDKINSFKLKPLKFRYSYWDKHGVSRGLNWE